jgi:two-component system sensor histidine kinase ChvG
VETLPLARSEESRGRLLAVIQHDVKRLDRLISDISEASRLDAELQRSEAAPVDLRQLLTTLIASANDLGASDAVPIQLQFKGSPNDAFLVPGHDSRIGQVIANLIDNARSFSPPTGSVRVTCRRRGDGIDIVVEDDGPGIASDAFEKIFERFYTDRPNQGFGQNSGLGLSISRQIVEAHGGKITVENRLGEKAPGESEAPVLGARFTVRLPTK